jgi:hypothetical protein
MHWHIDGRYQERGLVAEVLNTANVDALFTLNENRDSISRARLRS